MQDKQSSFLVKDFDGIRYSTPFEMMEISQAGLTKDILIKIANILNLTQKDLAEMMAISLRTFQRYRSNKKLNHIVTEHVLQLIDVIRQGSEVFGSRELFIEWLQTPNTAFGRRKPVTLLKFRAGCDMVSTILGQIKHGIIA